MQRSVLVRLIRASRAFALSAAALGLVGCAEVGQLFPGGQVAEISSQVADAQSASVPDKASFPEAEPQLKTAGRAFASRRGERYLRGVFTRSGWESKRRERTVPVVLFSQRAAKGVVKGADGESQVCFQFDCALVQQRFREEYGDPFLDCNETEFQKVICSSVDEL